VEGLIFTVAIGLLGGAYPAFRAARLLPTEAIRHE
jgi:putative ABC transport system permease protein